MGFQDIIKYQSHQKTNMKSFCDGLGGFCLGCDAISCKKWTAHLSKGNTKAFHEYIYVFMKILLDDFRISNDLSTHLKKLKNCFLKCRKFNINLNLDKCAFMMFSRTILGFIVSKEGKIMDPKKVEALINMPIPINP